MRARNLLPCCTLAIALAASAQASADDAMSDTARDLFIKGAKAAEQQKWDQCRAALLAALAIKPHPQIAGNLAGCELKLKLHRDAAEHLAYALRELKADAPPDRRTNIEAALREAQAKVEAVRLSVNVVGAEVRVDEHVVGRAPLPDPIFVEPGTHTIEALQEGFPAARATIEAKAGGVRDLALELKKIELPPPPPQPPLPSLPPVKQPPTWLLVTTGVLAAGGLAAGAGLTVAANGKGGQADAAAAGVPPSGCAGAGASSANCKAIKDALTSESKLSNAAVATFIAGGALALATAGLGVWAGVTRPKPDEPRAVLRVVPVLASSGGGLVVGGAW